MSRSEMFEQADPVDDEGEDLIEKWNAWGRKAMFVCIWAAMAIPVLLVIYVRLSS
jgi:hypothetical protein